MMNIFVTVSAAAISSWSWNENSHKICLRCVCSAFELFPMDERKETVQEKKKRAKSGAHSTWQCLVRRIRKSDWKIANTHSLRHTTNRNTHRVCVCVAGKISPLRCCFCFCSTLSLFLRFCIFSRQQNIKSERTEFLFFPRSFVCLVMRCVSALRIIWIGYCWFFSSFLILTAIRSTCLKTFILMKNNVAHSYTGSNFCVDMSI